MAGAAGESNDSSLARARCAKSRGRRVARPAFDVDPACPWPNQLAALSSWRSLAALHVSAFVPRSAPQSTVQFRLKVGYAAFAWPNKALNAMPRPSNNDEESDEDDYERDDARAEAATGGRGRRRKKRRSSAREEDDAHPVDDDEDHDNSGRTGGGKKKRKNKSKKIKVMEESGQTDEERRALRRAQRKLQHKIVHSALGEKLEDPDADAFEQIRGENNQLFDDVRYTREAVLDGDNLELISRRAARQVDKLVEVSTSTSMARSAPALCYVPTFVALGFGEKSVGS